MAPIQQVLITGASGFVGRKLQAALRERLPEAGLTITGRHEHDVPDGDVHFVELDVTDRQAVNDLIRATRPTAIVHLAAVSAVQEARLDPQRAWMVNAGGTLNLAQAVLQHAPRARFLFISTSEIYGGTFKTAGAPLNERAVLDPANAYAASKAAADLLIGQMARDGLQAIRLRPFNHTGPGQGEQFVIPAFCAQIARIEKGLQPPVIKVGNLDAQRDFLDVRDVVDAYLAALMLQPFEPGLILNLASGSARRIGDILNELLALATVDIRVEPDPERMRPNDTPFAIGDSALALQILGWQPRIPWQDTLRGVLEDWRSRMAIPGPV
jgi:GDP-4-dehydro-6-deoxy-D-mannose reductase